jgi:hypothetical protein
MPQESVAMLRTANLYIVMPGNLHGDRRVWSLINDALTP